MHRNPLPWSRPYFVLGSFAIQIVSKLIERKEMQKANRGEKGATAR